MTDGNSNVKLDVSDQRLRALRAKIVASEEPLLTAEAIEQEIDEQRDRLKESEVICLEVIDNEQY